MRARRGYLRARAREVVATTAPLSLSLTRLVLCSYPTMLALAQDRELWAIPTAIADSAKALVTARTSLRILYVTVPAFGLLV